MTTIYYSHGTRNVKGDYFDLPHYIHKPKEKTIFYSIRSKCFYGSVMIKTVATMHRNGSDFVDSETDLV